MVGRRARNQRAHGVKTNVGGGAKSSLMHRTKKMSATEQQEKKTASSEGEASARTTGYNPSLAVR